MTSEEDRREAAELIKEGSLDFALLVPEDLPLEDIRDLFVKAGLVASIDAAQWPSRVRINTQAGPYELKKVEEGVYRIKLAGR